MKEFAGQLLLRSRYPLAILAGLLLAAAFLEIGLAGLAWVAPAFTLAAAHGKTGADAFRIGYVAGLAYHLASLYWLLLIPVKGYPILGWISLSAYLALYPATWVWLLSGFRGQASLVTWTSRTAWSLFGAAAWVALEMIQARLFSGFPWNFVGTSQYRMLPLIQIASVTGVYGVSFVVVWFSLSIYSAVGEILRRPTYRHVWMGEITLPITVVLALFMFGLGRLREQRSDAPTLRVTFIQPSIPQTMIWDETESENRFRQLLELTQGALASTGNGTDQTNKTFNPGGDPVERRQPDSQKTAALFRDAATPRLMEGSQRTDLLLWPEAAVPKMIRYDEPTFRAIAGLAKSNALWMIIGSDDAEPRPHAADPDEADYFNSSFLVTPDGELANRYHKRHRVIFGEYIPLARWLPFVKWFTPITGGFTAGEHIVPFELQRAGAPIKTATLICFEDVFPHLVREYVDAATDFLVNLTNDGWFGEGAQQWQHAAGAVFRAVENGLPLLRCCNNGLTCWIDSRGRLRDILRDKDGRIYGAGVMTSEIPVLAPEARRARTFYNRHGDRFGWVCVGVTALLALKQLGFLRRRPAAA